jgi:hypothetical protein
MPSVDGIRGGLRPFSQEIVVQSRSRPTGDSRARGNPRAEGDPTQFQVDLL